MTLSHIAAMSNNRIIGSNNQLPWHIPEDLKFFKNKTKGHICIMGRKTYESMSAPLPNRLNIIITRQSDYAAPKAMVAPNLNEAIELARKKTHEYGDEVFICGGGEIYKQSLGLVDKIYLTHIYKDFQGDAFYPELDPEKFIEVERIEHQEPIPFAFLTFNKK